MLRNFLGSKLKQSLTRRRQKTLLVEGWRGISHSYAMANQYQLLELARHPRLRLFHRDMPFYGADWSAARSPSGFTGEDARVLDALAPPPAAGAEVTYRIDYPHRLDNTTGRPAYVMATSELQRLPADNIHGGAAALRARSADVKIITPSHWSRQGFLSAGFDEQEVSVVPHGVDARIYRPLAPPARRRLRSMLGIGEEAFVFLSVGSMTWNKGIDVLLLAFAEVRRKYPHVRLMLKDHPTLFNISAATLLMDLRYRHPQRFDEQVLSGITISSDNMGLEQLAGLYGLSDAYVSPYRGEGFGLTPLEAAACGTPVVLTSGGATDDYADPSFALGVPGDFITEAEKNYIEPDLGSLIDAMSRMVEGAVTSIDQAAALAYIHANFSWQSVVGRLLETLFGAL